MMTVYVHYFGDANGCGTEYNYYEKYTFDENSLAAYEEIFSEVAEEFRLENAESYEYLETGWDEDFEDEEAREEYYDDCEGGWQYITKEEYEEYKEDETLC